MLQYLKMLCHNTLKTYCFILLYIVYNCQEAIKKTYIANIHMYKYSYLYTYRYIYTNNILVQGQQDQNVTCLCFLEITVHFTQNSTLEFHLSAVKEVHTEKLCA